MVTLIARRAIYKTKAGGILRVTSTEARVLLALKLADEAPPPAPAVVERPKREYKRRDMVAEAPPVVATPWIDD